MVDTPLKQSIYSFFIIFFFERRIFRMVNYPTILNLPQEDINRQLYLKLKELEDRVKALEDES